MEDRPEGVGRDVLFEVAEHIATVTLNRPDKRNAVNGAVAQALGWIVETVEADPDIRVAILASSNDVAFCAGADLKEVSTGNATSLFTERGGFAGFADAPKDKPWIAAVAGSAFGGGTEIALACDMIVAADTARFGLPEVKRGILAGAGGVYRLPRALPKAIALELIATGEPLTAERAGALGFANRVVPVAELAATARALALAIAANAPVAVRESLKVARQTLDHDEPGIREIALAAMKRVTVTEDSKEGPRAFVEKRAPVWKGR